MIVAPGKVVLVGEYAVLDGAPAVVAAVDRGVSCVVGPGRQGAREVEVPDDDRFVRAALAAVDAPPARYVFADWNPVASAAKVGLGGSAAATVAAILAGAPALDRDVRYELALRVHREVQGSGSGIDVAASTFGGVSRFVVGERPSPLAVRPVLSVVSAGEPAKTGPRVLRYLANPDRASFVADSTAIVDAFAADPVRALRANGERLRAMAEAVDLPYWTPAIDALVRLAAEHGGGAKPSGAGGGDIVVAAFPDEALRDDFEAACVRAGFLVVGVSICPGAHEP